MKALVCREPEICPKHIGIWCPCTPSGVLGLEILHANFECVIIYRAGDIGLSTQEFNVHAH